MANMLVMGTPCKKNFTFNETKPANKASNAPAFPVRDCQVEVDKILKTRESTAVSSFKLSPTKLRVFDESH